MRIPVFARRANPSVDRWILKKSEAYALEQVLAGRADWVDPDDRSKGIICRETLYFGARAMRAETVELPTGFNPFRADGELKGIKFQPPKSESKPSLDAIREAWDWQFPLPASDPCTLSTSAT
jgi:hypothetical protein